MKNLTNDQLKLALALLEERLFLKQARALNLVVCGGSALIATNLIQRTTKDVDIVALMQSGELVDPEPLPAILSQEAKLVAEHYQLPSDWLNCGPADLFRMGLPKGFKERLIKDKIGESLTIYFISRLDQIHFKLYASVDRGGYHIDDLMSLDPKTDELIAAAKWSMTHDVSEGYAFLLKELLNQLGYRDVAEQI